MRSKLKKIYGIPVDAWDRNVAPSVIANDLETPAPKASVAPVVSTEASSSPDVPSEGNATTEAMLREQVTRSRTIASDMGLDAETRLRAEARLTHALRALAAHTGEADAMTEAKLVKHPAFKRAMTVLLDALSPYPEAMRAAGLAMRTYEQSGGAEAPKEADVDA
jgi:hypothetical protein